MSESSLIHLDQIINAKKTAMNKLLTQSGKLTPAKNREMDSIKIEIRQLEEEKQQILLEMQLQAGIDTEGDNQIMDGETDYFSAREIAQALRDIHSPSEIGCSKLATVFYVNTGIKEKHYEDTPYNRGLILIDLLNRAIEEIKPKGLSKQAESEWRLYNAIQFRYKDGLGRTETAKELSISLPHYDRIHKNALGALSQILKNYEAEAQIKGVSLTMGKLLRRPTLFIGRDNEIARINEAISPNHRQWLLIILGPGGIGKTTLAIELAHRVRETSEFDAIIWADSRTEVMKGAGRRQKQQDVYSLDQLFLLIAEGTGTSLSRQAPTERKKAALNILNKKRCLLIIDNFDVLETQPEFRHFLEDEVPDPSKVIVTTRHDTLEGGRVVKLNGLSASETKTLVTSNAYEQNIESLKDLSSEMTDLIQQATGGSPLATEWFIGQVKLFDISPEDLANELLGQQTGRDEELLEFCFGRSYAELGQVDKDILFLFPFFTSSIGISVPTVKSLLRVESHQMHRSLSLLRRLSLIQDINSGRYNTIDLVTRFVLKKIDHDHKSRLLKKIVSYWEKYLQSYKSEYARISREYKNILFVIDWALSEGKQLKEASLLLIEMGNFLFKHGHWSELSQYGERVLSACIKSGYDEIVAKLEIEHLGWISYHLKEWDKLYNYSNHGLIIAESIADRRLKALALRNLGLHQRENGNLNTSKETFEQALSLLSSAGTDEEYISVIEGSYIVALTRLRLFAEAENLLIKEVNRAKEINDLERASIATYRLGALAHEEQDLQRAERLLLESISLDHQLERFSSEAYTYDRLSKVYEACNKFEQALKAAKEAQELFTAIGAGNSTAERLEERIGYLSKMQK